MKRVKYADPDILVRRFLEDGLIDEAGAWKIDRWCAIFNSCALGINVMMENMVEAGLPPIGVEYVETTDDEGYIDGKDSEAAVG